MQNFTVDKEHSIMSVLIWIQTFDIQIVPLKKLFGKDGNKSTDDKIL